MDQHTRDVVARLRHEAAQHRQRAKSLDAARCAARDRHDPIGALHYKSAASELRGFARQADAERRDLAQVARITRITKRYEAD